MIVTFSIEPDGSVGDASVIGSPPARFAAVALEAVRRWKFEPAQKDGKPIRVQVSQSIGFRPDQ